MHVHRRPRRRTIRLRVVALGVVEPLLQPPSRPPPAISTEPSGNSVAACFERGSRICGPGDEPSRRGIVQHTLDSRLDSFVQPARDEHAPVRSSSVAVWATRASRHRCDRDELVRASIVDSATASTNVPFDTHRRRRAPSRRAASSRSVRARRTHRRAGRELRGGRIVDLRAAVTPRASSRRQSSTRPLASSVPDSPVRPSAQRAGGFERSRGPDSYSSAARVKSWLAIIPPAIQHTAVAQLHGPRTTRVVCASNRSRAEAGRVRPPCVRRCAHDHQRAHGGSRAPRARPPRRRRGAAKACSGAADRAQRS